MKRKPKLPRRSPPTPSTIGFRLDEALATTLVERASALRVSPHDLARNYVVERLSKDEDLKSVLEAIRVTADDLQEFREDFAHAVQALLMSAGTIKKDVAKAWVEENLLRP